MYTYRYSFNEGGATITVGAWDPDRWPDEEDTGGFVWGMTADVHAHSDIKRAIHVSVNQGSMQVTPAEALARSEIYVNAAKIGEWIEQQAADGKTLVEIGNKFTTRVVNYKPLAELVTI